MTACIDTPISWLRLERYQAGEISGDERERIAKHLASCAACAACLRRIEEDNRELPPLPETPKKSDNVFTLRRVLPWASAFAIAALILLYIGRERPSEPTPDMPPGVRIKGGEVSFSLVNADDTVFEGGAVYRDGDRFKVIMTCPPGMRGAFDVVVYEGNEAAFPLEPPRGLACGNGVAIPGAFRATGHDRMNVCLVWDESGAVDREALRHTRPERIPHATCKELAPAQ